VISSCSSVGEVFRAVRIYIHIGSLTQLTVEVRRV